jgi:hypothetical protein
MKEYEETSRGGPMGHEEKKEEKEADRDLPAKDNVCFLGNKNKTKKREIQYPNATKTDNDGCGLPMEIKTM